MTSNWLNIAGEQAIVCAHALFLSSDDKNTEHYRWQLFKSALGYRQNLTDIRIEQLFALALSENDLPLKSSMLHELIGLQGIPQDLIARAAQAGNNSVSRKAYAIMARMKHLAE